MFWEPADPCNTAKRPCCFYYYVLTNGQHPFEKSGNRIRNPKDEVYTNPDKALKALKEKGNEAFDVIKKMIQFDRGNRLSIDEVLKHDYFSTGKNYYQLYETEGVKPGLCVIYDQEIFQVRRTDPKDKLSNIHYSKNLLCIFNRHKE